MSKVKTKRKTKTKRGGNLAKSTMKQGTKNIENKSKNIMREGRNNLSIFLNKIKNTVTGRVVPIGGKTKKKKLKKHKSKKHKKGGSPSRSRTRSPSRSRTRSPSRSRTRSPSRSRTRSPSRSRTRSPSRSRTRSPSRSRSTSTSPRSISPKTHFIIDGEDEYKRKQQILNSPSTYVGDKIKFSGNNQESQWEGDVILEDGKKVLANVKNPYYDDDY